MKYKDWLDEWLEFYVKSRTKERTYLKYAKQVEKYIIPELGKYELEELSAQILQRFSIELFNKGLAKNTINSIVSVLKSSVKDAVRLGITNIQHLDAIVRSKAREKKVESFTKEEQQKIEKHILESRKDKLFGIIMCLYTGLRIGELLALNWSDIDLKRGLIVVTKSCHDKWKDKYYIKVLDTLKTENSYRIIPIPKQLLSRLKDLKKQAKSDFVISGKAMYGAEMRSYQRTFETLLKRIGLQHKGFHALRHTFATRALEVGMDVKTLSEILGHSNPTITLKRYAHSMLEHKIEMMNRVGKLLL